MCGIAGVVGDDPRREAASRVRAMMERLRHRGPDANGLVELDGQGALGHTRLAIIDLSERGRQPMRHGSLIASYNGEVYNFQELRQRLERDGVQFASATDTEVVMAAYARWGTDAFAMFDGMFAVALWDSERRELILARDRFGEKPLYYTLDGGTLAFASEISALTTERTPRISLAALNHFLAIGYVLSPLTIYEGVHKLEPAHFLRVRGGRIVEHTRYWDYRACFDQRRKLSLDDAAAELQHLLQATVHSRLVSDVPIGSFLSGGVDSSGIVAMMKRTFSGTLHSFSIGFDQESYSEAADAHLVARHVGTQHHEESLDGNAAQRLIEEAVAAYDEPFSDTSLVPMVALARTTRRHVTVALSGDGADEIFGGYVTYLADALHQRMSLVPRALRTRMAQVMRALARDSNRKTTLSFKLKQFSRGLPCDSAEAHYRWRELRGLDERLRIFGPSLAELVIESDPARVFAAHDREAHGLDSLSRHLYVDAKTFLADDVLVKVDRAAMAASLETRAPFLGLAIACFAASLPSELKVRGRLQKRVLKRALAGVVPDSTLAKKKAGFNAPINGWLGASSDDDFRNFNAFVAARWNHGALLGEPHIARWLSEEVRLPGVRGAARPAPASPRVPESSG
jgi:asparagine synthase (glutamine-hydrolysing)